MTDATTTTHEPVTEPAQLPFRLKLVVATGADFAKELVLESGAYRIGKDLTADLVLSDARVSRLHLLIELLPSGVKLTDLNSTNGSFCDGQRFNTVEPKPGSRLKLGDTEIKVVPVAVPNPLRIISEKTRFGDLVGDSVAMRELFGQLERLATTGKDVLLRGETGAGKEFAARSIHAQSPRAAGPLVVCDLNGLPAELVESELFGHTEGSFAGATSARLGVIERADKGTLFIEEVGEVPLELQPRLLEFLQGRIVRQRGATTGKDVDVRVIAATRRDLLSEVGAGRFREDLLALLSATVARLPPLRARADDFPVLVNDLLQRIKRLPVELSLETLTLLAAQPWHGNVRELKILVERAVSGAAVPETAATLVAPAALPIKEAKDKLIAAVERDYLLSVLKRANQNAAEAARELGVERGPFFRLLDRHALTAREGT